MPLLMLNGCLSNSRESRILNALRLRILLNERIAITFGVPADELKRNGLFDQYTPHHMSKE